MSNSRPAIRALAFASAILALSACVQTNVGRAPLDESNEPRRVERPTPAPSASPSLAPSPPPSLSLSPSPASAPAALEPASAPTAAPPTPPETQAPAPARAATPAIPAPGTERAGEPFVLQAAPCKSQGRHVRVPIPRPESIDASYRGAAAGIEIRRTLRAGSAGFRHVRLAGGVLEADLWARGSGLAVGALGTEACRGGEAADVSFEVIVHYR